MFGSKAIALAKTQGLRLGGLPDDEPGPPRGLFKHLWDSAPAITSSSLAPSRPDVPACIPPAAAGGAGRPAETRLKVFLAVEYSPS